jgi:hypothetical protein
VHWSGGPAQPGSIRNLIYIGEVRPPRRRPGWGAKRRGAHSKKRERRPLPGMLLFQDGSTHRWIAALGRDLHLVVTLDDAHKATLLEIADGWIRCAVLAERDKLKADTLS